MKVGVYIDADNISHRDYSEIEELAHNKGEVIIKKVFGDWTKPEMKNWQKIMFDYGVEPIQAFRKNKKNSSDICMITDMIFDAVTVNHLDCMIIGSCDSDFSYACIKLKALNINLTVVSYGHTLLSNYTHTLYMLKSNDINNINNINNENLPLDDILGFKRIIRYSKLSKTEKNLISDEYIIKYKNRKYVINSYIMQKSIKKLKKNKNKIIEHEQEIFNVIPFDSFIESLVNN